MWTSTNPALFPSPSPLAAILDEDDDAAAASNGSRSLHRSMEDVWKDIGISSDHLHRHRQPSSRGVILMDFFSEDQPPVSVTGSPAQLPPQQLPTALTLSSARDPRAQYADPRPLFPNVADSADPNRQQQPPPPFDHDHLQAFNHNNNAGKRVLPDLADRRNPGDRRQKRMIKNRESAARSRARKQAYTYELELEVAHLMEENSRLKKQQQQLVEAAANQNPKRKLLHRTSTAPF